MGNLHLVSGPEYRRSSGTAHASRSCAGSRRSPTTRCFGDLGFAAVPIPNERRSAEGESLVVVRSDLLAALPVTSEPAHVGHEHPGLAFDVAAQVPAVAAGRGVHRALGDLVH